MNSAVPARSGAERNPARPNPIAQPNRLPEHGLIDRGRVLPFYFDGRPYAGHPGDTLASALLAAGVRLVGRSFKYHRPRGILTAGPEEPNALVELRAGSRCEPNTRATIAELFAGLEARSQNRWPSLKWDFRAINSLLSPLLVAGFYYKTFMWPAALWEKLYEPAIRRAAGLGRASGEPDPDSYEKTYAFCDVLIIGAGPAGLAAALAAARSGARIILCDEDFLLGGRLNADQREIDGSSGVEWTRRAEDELTAMPNVRILRRTTVFGSYDGSIPSERKHATSIAYHGAPGARTFGAVERVSDHLPVPPAHQPRQRLWKIVAKRTVLAAGAIERPLVFGGNDRPGVMMGSAVRTYVNRFGVTPGQCIALFTTTDDGWRTAFELGKAKITVAAIIDARQEVAPALLAKAKRIQARILCGSEVIDTQGRRKIQAVSVRDGSGRIQKLSVDTLAISGGWNPNIALSTHLGARSRWSDHASAFVPGDLPPGMTVIGAAAGSYSLSEALRAGASAGARAVEEIGFPAAKPLHWQADDDLVGMRALWFVTHSRSKAFVDFQHDVTRDDIALAVREGYQSVELLKRYTTLGMATDQGKTSNLNGHAIVAGLTQRTIAEVGTTAHRPPYTPVAIGALAGRHQGKLFRPVRMTASHDWARERGATFVEVGPWLRARWFAARGEKEWLDTVRREVSAVRGSVGVCDISTLGKIDVQGPDAGTFLDRIYINVFSTLPVSKARYGLLLREDGIVMDDGTTARLSPTHYVMSTTTINAPKVMHHLEYARQVIWPELDVQVSSVTEQWAQYAIAGPNSRALLQRLLGDAIDVSAAAFAYMACAEFSWRGVPVRLFRLSFSGELAYELAVPARYGDATIRSIMAAGEPFGVSPYGTEALNVMRVEKGHIGGNEINGMTTAADLGRAKMMSTTKDFIGSVLARRPGLSDPNRPALVGLKPVDRSSRLYAGAHLLTQGASPTLANDQGYITSVAYSPMLGHWIGLGLLARGPQRMGEFVRTYSPIRGGDLDVEVVSPVFFDPDQERLHG